MTFLEALEWGDRRIAEVASERSFASMTQTLGDLAALEVEWEPRPYQHLLFEVGAELDVESDPRPDQGLPFMAGRGVIGFSRQFFPGGGEVEIIGFQWEMAHEDRREFPGEITLFGARPGEVCEIAGSWLPWDDFQAEVERQVQARVAAGWRLTGRFTDG